ncbi:hydrogenase [Candidatus Dependentiae bacterium]|nr:hydrogenase [Candidatus Dependentiae bacterium]
MISVLIIIPLILSVLVFLFNSKKLNNFALIWYSILHLTITVLLYIYGGSLGKYFKIDSLNILFLLVQSVLLFCISIYSSNFLKSSENKWHKYYTVSFLLFILSMDCAILSSHLALMWVFVEATTLTSAILIYFHRTKSTVEATWKYIFICSIGISFAFIGIILLSIGCKNIESLFFSDLYKPGNNVIQFWLKFAFPFILVGFGTKMGLAPVHAWLPDAHSEAPSPVSAILSGALLNAALLGILRVYKMCIIYGLNEFAENLFLIMGFLSVTVSAAYIIKITNYKRMLAYSSIENMGIITIGFGLGGKQGIFAALLHLTGHSLIKASLFLTSGNILHIFKTKDSDKIRGLYKADNITGWLWMFGILAICGFPPFSIFISELLIVKSMFIAKQYIKLIVFVGLLTVILYGLIEKTLKMNCYEPQENIDKKHIETGFCVYAPQMILLGCACLLGIYIPGKILNILSGAALWFGIAK